MIGRPLVGSLGTNRLAPLVFGVQGASSKAVLLLAFLHRSQFDGFIVTASRGPRYRLRLDQLKLGKLGAFHLYIFHLCLYDDQNTNT